MLLFLRRMPSIFPYAAMRNADHNAVFTSYQLTGRTACHLRHHGRTSILHIKIRQLDNSADTAFAAVARPLL